MTTYKQSSDTYDYDDQDDSSHPQNNHKQTKKNNSDDRPTLSLGDRIVWLSDSGAEYGYVRWLGKLHELGQEWMAGVEFDNPVGSGTGLYKDTQLFVTSLNHASLVPIIGLLKASDFEGPPRPPARSSSVRLIDINHEPSSSDHYQRQYNQGSNNNSARLSNSHRSSTSYRPNECVNRTYMTTTGNNLPSYSNCHQTSNNYNNGRQPAPAAVTHQTSSSSTTSSSRVRHIPIRIEQDNDTIDDFINQHHQPESRAQSRRIPMQQQKPLSPASSSMISRKTVPNSNNNNHNWSPTPVNAMSSLKKDHTDNSSSIIIEDLSAHMNRTKLSLQEPLATQPQSKPQRQQQQQQQPQQRSQLIDISPSNEPSSNYATVPLLPSPPLEVATNEKNASTVLKNYLGKSRGIQGHNNSCYLDATLFAMFSSTTLFDSLLYRPRNRQDIPGYDDIQKVLREDIVRPLRKDFIVNADQVMIFRTLLEQSSTVEGLTDEEKDPEEFLNLLLGQILKADPYLKLSSGLSTFFYQLIVDKVESVVLPTVQDLFEQSFMKDSSNVRLSEIPACLMLQMPRFGRQFKMYSRIMPTLKLDITDVLEAAPRPCGYRGKDCDNIAAYECRDCFGDRSGRSSNKLSSNTYCNNCFQSKHFGKSHSTGIEDHDKTKTILNKTPADAISRYSNHKGSCKDKEIPRVYMDLFAVLCIETSHYVCFVKCGQNPEAPWCFFDSMADRRGEQNGYNIPEVLLFDEFGFWTSEKGLPFLLNHKDDKLLPEMARRLICDAYLCFYQYPGLITYR